MKYLLKHTNSKIYDKQLDYFKFAKIIRRYLEYEKLQ